MGYDIDFFELDGYPREDITADKFTAVRRLLVPWDQREDLKWALLGWPGAIYPYIPNWAIRCVALSMEPWGLMDGDPVYLDVATYDYAVITARYESPSWGEPQPYPASDPTKHVDITKTISESIEPSMEARRLDHSLFTWSDGTALKEQEAPVKLLYRLTYTLTRHFQEEIPYEAISYVGKINDAEVTPVLMNNIVFPAHTLMFVPPSLSLSKDPNGNTTFDVQFRFAYKGEGWRKFWRTEKSGDDKYDTMKVKKDGTDYEMPLAADFSVLFP